MRNLAKRSCNNGVLDISTLSGHLWEAANILQGPVDAADFIRRQLALSQEDLARRIGVSYATVNRWENGLSKPSMLAKAQLETFCKKMTSQGKLTIAEGGAK